MTRRPTPISAKLRVGGFFLFAAGVGLVEWVEGLEIRGTLLGIAGLLLFAVSFPTATLELIRDDIQKRGKSPDREEL